MRNLRVYPPTQAEIVDCLQRHLVALPEPNPGDMDMTLLRFAIDIVQSDEAPKQALARLNQTHFGVNPEET